MFPVSIPIFLKVLVVIAGPSRSQGNAVKVQLLENGARAFQNDFSLEITAGLVTGGVSGPEEEASIHLQGSVLDCEGGREIFVLQMLRSLNECVTARAKGEEDGD